MFAALSSEAEENYFADNLNGLIALAPCIQAAGNMEKAFPGPEGREASVAWLDARPNLSKQFPINSDGASNDALCAAAGEDSGHCGTVRFITAVGLSTADENTVLQYEKNWSQDRFQA